MIDITVAIGISKGLTIILERKSANTTSIDPIRIVVGNSFLKFPPTIIFARCGTTSPTKEIKPTCETVIDARNTLSDATISL